MASSYVQIPNLGAITALAGAELFEAVQAGVSRKVSLNQIAAYAQQTPFADLTFTTPLVRTGSNVALTTVPISLGGTGAATDQLASENLNTAFVVANLAALKALTSRPAAVVVEGRTAPNDGWGGTFDWIPFSSTTADDALVVSCTTGATGRYKRLYTGPVHSKWFATGDGVTDDTAGVEAWLASLPLIHLDAGRYNITEPVSTAGAQNMTITGDGNLAMIMYVGADPTPGDLVTIGDGTAYIGADFSGFGIGSTTRLTGGAALRIRNVLGVQARLLINGPPDIQGNLWDGIWADGSSLVSTAGSIFKTRHDPVVMNTGYEFDLNGATVSVAPILATGNTHSNTTINGMSSTADLLAGMFVSGEGVPKGRTIASVDSATQITLSGATTETATGVVLEFREASSICIHVAGGYGGLTTAGMNQLSGVVGIKIDNSIDPAGNTQFFITLGKLDSNILEAVLVDDSTVNPLSKVLYINGWLGTNKHSVRIANWRGGDFNSATGVFKNNWSHAIVLNDPTVTVTLGYAVEIADNVGWGVSATSPITIQTQALPRNNGSGSFSPNITTTNTMVGSSRAFTDALAGGAQLRLATGNGEDTDESLMAGILDGSYAWVQASKPGTAPRLLYLNPNGGAVLCGGTLQSVGSAGGTADALTATPTPALPAYTTLGFYLVKATATNATTTPTINISGLGAKTIVKRAATALAAGDIVSGMILHLAYDGTNMQLLNPVVN